MDYQLTTIKDIFDNVPSDKVELCLKELAVGIVQAQQMNELICETAGILHGEKPENAVEWPETCTWTDDDKGEIDLSFVSEEGEGIGMKTKLSV